MTVDVRPVRDDELDSTVAVLRSAGLGTTVGRLLELPRSSPGGEVLCAVDGGQVIGGAATACFGATGWIGALGVAPAGRRRGVGTRLATAAVDWLRGAGAGTVLLYATDAGRPIYSRLGFDSEGEAHAWRDAAPPRGRMPAGVRAVAAADLEEIRRLDAIATGEDRSLVLDRLDPPPDGSGLVFERDGRVAGSALRSPWGLGPSIVAEDADAGLTLVAALRRESGPPLTVSLPDANTAGVRALRAWGLRPINHATRMRLGPAASYAPERVFGLFNLFWG
jgi:GNAT superfamily N-acetyltransferase